MKFVLEIELGNAAMRIPSHVAKALEAIAERLRDNGFHTASKIRDINGNTVGKYEVMEANGDEHRDQEILNLLWESLKRDPEHTDRRQTAWGTKTQAGLVASLNRIYQGEV